MNPSFRILRGVYRGGRFSLRIVELEIEGHHSGAHLGLSEDPGDDLDSLVLGPG